MCLSLAAKCYISSLGEHIIQVYCVQPHAIEPKSQISLRPTKRSYSNIFKDVIILKSITDASNDYEASLSKVVPKTTIPARWHRRPAEHVAKVKYLIWNHDERIENINTIRAYSFGSNYFVEVNIVLPKHTPLPLAHDIGESLQLKLEKLPQIERAFVHVDLHTDHTKLLHTQN
ncbi:hypothetical protein K1719_029026 [Acacia pycnantha]|nr:hypothetical protein K1719_029026 [Acacia pycnantha]